MVDVEPGFRVLHVDAGPRAPVPLRELPDLRRRVHRRRARRARAHRRADVDVLHANYWVSGAVGHRLKHELDLPLVTTFHTLERVKAEVGLDDDPARRAQVEAEVVRCADLVVASTREERDQLVAPLRRRARAHRDHPARRRPRGVLARRPRARRAAHVGARRRPGAAVRRSHPAAQGRRPRGALPRRARRPACAARRRRRPERPRRRRRSSTRCTRWSRELGLAAPRAVRRRRSPTTRSPTTTAPPTCASCRRAPSRSGSWRSRPRRAARRWSRQRRRAALARRRRRHRLPRRRPRPRGVRRRASTACCGDPSSRPSMRCAAATRARRATRWSIAAARLRRLYADLAARRCATVRVQLDSSSTALGALAGAHELLAAHLEGPVAAEPCVQTRRVRPRAAPLVRALRVRRPRRDHDLLRSAPAHAALRGVLPPVPAASTTSSSTSSS